MPQFVELDIFFEAFERSVAGELLEAGDVDALRDAARDRPAPQAMPGKGGSVEPGLPGPFFDDQRDRIGVDRAGTNPAAVGYRFFPGTLANAWRRQMPQPAEQRTIDNLRRGEPSFERRYRAQIGLTSRQPHSCAVCLLVVLAPRQKQGDAVLMAGQRSDIEPGQFGGPQCRGETDQDQGPIAMTGQGVGDRA